MSNRRIDFVIPEMTRDEIHDALMVELREIDNGTWCSSENITAQERRKELLEGLAKLS